MNLHLRMRHAALQSSIRDLCTQVRDLCRDNPRTSVEWDFVATAPEVELAQDTMAIALEAGRLHLASAAGLLAVAALESGTPRLAAIREAAAIIWRSRS